MHGCVLTVASFRSLIGIPIVEVMAGVFACDCVCGLEDAVEVVVERSWLKVDWRQSRA
jgi:hypothetical protein